MKRRSHTEFAIAFLIVTLVNSSYLPFIFAPLGKGSFNPFGFILLLPTIFAANRFWYHIFALIYEKYPKIRQIL